METIFAHAVCHQSYSDLTPQELYWLYTTCCVPQQLYVIMRQLPVLITISWLITDVYMEVSTKYLFNISLGISYIISSNPWKSPGTNIKSLQFWTLSKSKTCSEFYINITDTKKRFLEFQLIYLYYICFFNEITLKNKF